jgi:hypothetical protein
MMLRYHIRASEMLFPLALLAARAERVLLSRALSLRDVVAL